jgi:NAD(P)H dehydrogenase (quinone)
MNALIVYAHPYEKSLNHAIKEALVDGLNDAGLSVDVVDLYKDEFNPTLDREGLRLYRKGEYKDPMVGGYMRRIEQADHLFFIFPIWWQDTPAILKGFLDKVFLNKWAFETKGFHPKGYLTHLKATVITTMNTPGFYYCLRYRRAVKHTLIDGALKFCGIKRVKWINLNPVSLVSRRTREKWLDKVRRYAKSFKC